MDKQWFKKSSPKELEDLNHSPRVTELLKQLSKKPNFPHLLIYGPPGSGKYVRAKCFLKEVFGHHVHYVQFSQEEIYQENKEGNYSKGTFYTVGKSQYHIEIDIANYNQKDSKILHNLIESCSYKLAKENNEAPKVLIIRSSCKLSKIAQTALRATMEKYTERMRIIFICQKIHCIIAPIRSRCLSIKVKAPTDSQIYNMLIQTSCVFYSKIPQSTMEKLIEISEGNIRKAYNYLQSCDILQKNNKNINLLFNVLDQDLLEIINMIFQYQNTAQSRIMVYKLKSGELLKSNLRQIPNLFFKKFIKRGVDDMLLKLLIHECSKYQHIFIDLMGHDAKLTTFMVLVEGCMNAIKLYEKEKVDAIKYLQEEKMKSIMNVQGQEQLGKNIQ